VTLRNHKPSAIFDSNQLRIVVEQFVSNSPPFEILQRSSREQKHFTLHNRDCIACPKWLREF